MQESTFNLDLRRLVQMPVSRNSPDPAGFNTQAALPFELRLQDVRSALQDVYDFFFDVNTNLVGKGLERLDEMLRPAIMSGVLSDMLTASLAKHSRALAVNGHFNGHPDLVVKGRYPKNAVQAGEFGTRTATLHAQGIAKLRQSWVYRAPATQP